MAIKITKDTTWSGYINLVENCVIDAGVTLTIAAGSTIEGMVLQRGFLKGGPLINGNGNIVIEGSSDNRVKISDLTFETFGGNISFNYSDFSTTFINIQPGKITGRQLESFNKIEVDNSTFYKSDINGGWHTSDYILGVHADIAGSTFNNSAINIDGKLILDSSEFRDLAQVYINNYESSTITDNYFQKATLSLVNNGKLIQIKHNDFYENHGVYAASINIIAAFDGVQISENNFHENNVAIDFTVTSDFWDYGGKVLSEGNWFGSTDPAIVSDRIINSDDLYIYGDVLNSNSASQLISTKYSPQTALVNNTSKTPVAGNTLDVIVDLFGTVSMLKGLPEINNGSVHTLTYNGNVFNYADVDTLLTTVVRNGEFTAEFAQEIADSYPTAAGITYNTVVSLVGAADLDNLLITVAGADGSYVS